MTQPPVAVRVHGVGDLRVEPVDAEEPRPDQAVVRVAYGGVCGSDLHYWRDGAVGASVLRAPMVLGHEVVGVVEHAAADGSSPAVGAAVAVHPAQSCGRCGFCTSGHAHLCRDSRYLGSAAHWPHTDGGFVTRLVVDSGRLLPVPAGLALRRAALAEPTAVAWHAVDRAAAIGAGVGGARVLVVGAGPIGLLVGVVARQHGAAAVTLTDVRPGPLRLAGRLGADEVIDAAGLAERAADYDVVLESSGAAAGLRTALERAARGGVVVAVGQVPRRLIDLPAWRVINEELTVTGSLRMDVELGPALDFLADPGVPVDELITAEFDHTDAPDAFAAAAAPDAVGKVLLRF